MKTITGFETETFAAKPNTQFTDEMFNRLKKWNKNRCLLACGRYSRGTPLI